MTYRDTDREAMVDELLLDADLADSSDVRQALLSLGTFANLSAPAPSAELAAMIAGPHDELSKRRWRHKHRTAVVSIAVVAAMGLGVSGVAAASSGFTRSPSFINELLGNLQPQPEVAAPVLPSPDAPRITTEAAPVADPAAVPPAAEVPSIPVAGTVPTQATPVEDPVQAPTAAKAPAADVAQPPAAVAVPEATVPTPAVPNGSKPNPAHNAQAKPSQVKPRGQEAVWPEASKPGAGQSDKPGAQGSKQGPQLPSLSDKRAEEQFQTAMDKWKQWMKRGHR
ncbi:hypothetical protein [Paenarthrobacter aurescens]|uniref:hypothetical protein n=1 Tax=Paenarthrobacter aurescens TaxID=43663 RepID=UPI0021BFB9DE|nr:hypothetical protein [Paenarthrobacter aurescens]MCT9870616.1 hypothetical protein [Paenarthrobacter aurescens]